MAKPYDEYLSGLANLIRHDDFLTYLKRLYPLEACDFETVPKMRLLYAQAARSGFLQKGVILSISSDLEQGLSDRGTAVIAAGTENSKNAVTNVARVAHLLNQGDFSNLPGYIERKISGILGDRNFVNFRRRVLPTDLTGEREVCLFETYLTADACFDEHGRRMHEVLCLINPRVDATILAIPPALANRIVSGAPPRFVLPEARDEGIDWELGSKARKYGQVLHDGKPIRGAKRMDIGMLRAAIADGDRFVRFQTAFSLVLFSKLTTSPVYHFRAGDSGAGIAWRKSLFTVIFGWWNLPAGPARVLEALLTNTKGGIDVTEEVLLQNLGPEGTRQVLALRPAATRSAGLGMWALRLGIALPPVLVVGGFAYLIFSQAIIEKKIDSVPGYAGFSRTEMALTNREGLYIVDGKDVSTLIEIRFRKRLAESGRQLPMENHDDAVFSCQRVANRLIVFAKFRPWKKWSDGERKLAADETWSAIRGVVADRSLDRDGDLVILMGIKGSMNWISLSEGGTSGPPTVVKMDPGEEDFVPLFVDETVVGVKTVNQTSCDGLLP